MELLSSDGASVEMRPLGYQFPRLDAGADWTDANWLNIQCRVRCADGRRWSFIFPCLLVHETQEFADWLSMAARARAASTLSFLEPTISFTLDHRARGYCEVAVTFRLEGQPPWQQGDARVESSWTVPLQLDQHMLAHAARTWRADCAAFPPRSP